MKSVYNVALLVALSCNFHLFPATLGLQCYGCAEGIETPNRCKDFEKANETEKKSKFTMNCSPAATGCAYMKFDIDNGQKKLNTESLECYVPDATLAKISKMNECKESQDGKSKYKVCACDSGDYCMKGGSSSSQAGVVGVVGFITLFMALVGRFLQF